MRLERNVIDFVTQVAEYLPGWTAYPDDTGWGAAMLLVNTDYPGEIRVVNRHRSWGNPDAFTHITAGWGSHSIGASVATGPAKVARQIERRLINHLHDYAAEQAREEARRERHRTRRARATHLAVEGLGCAAADREPLEPFAPQRGHGTFPAATGGIGLVEVTCSAYVSAPDQPLPAEDDMAGITVTMRIRGVTVEQAARINQVLTGQPATV